eukprot:GHVR01023354.1.p1 GENE.GHVR01023354.1~~GHVR01023354.1.p1  ORF type:complete len:105 (-),score=12.59 GHVR01023354.1:184-498(-)
MCMCMGITVVCCPTALHACVCLCVGWCVCVCVFTSAIVLKIHFYYFTEYVYHTTRIITIKSRGQYNLYHQHVNHSNIILSFQDKNEYHNNNNRYHNHYKYHNHY